MKHSKKCPQYRLIGYRYVRLKNSSIMEKNHYGQWTWSMDTTWMDDELGMDWLMVGCFSLFYLLTYLYIGTILENSGKFPAFCFSGKVTTLVTCMKVSVLNRAVFCSMQETCTRKTSPRKHDTLKYQSICTRFLGPSTYYIWGGCSGICCMSYMRERGVCGHVI